MSERLVCGVLLGEHCLEQFYLTDFICKKFPGDGQAAALFSSYSLMNRDIDGDE